MVKLTAEERDLHTRIVGALEKNLITVLINFRTLNTPGSPVFSPWEAIAPLLILLMTSLVVMVFVGIIGGIIALLFALLVYGVMVRPKLIKNMHARATRMILYSPQTFGTLWEFGGIALCLTERPTALVQAPDGSWQAFVRRLLPKAGETLDTAELRPDFTSSVAADGMTLNAPVRDRRTPS